MAMKINMEFAINPGTEATIGHILVAHSTDDINATARNLAQYENRVWDEKPYTYVHFGVDDIGVWQVAVPGHRANGAGNVNRYAPVQIELCEFRDKTRSLNAYKNFVALIQELAPKYGIPLTLDDSNRTAGIKSHAWCSQNYGGSDHQDPYPWLTSIGISKAQFLADIKGKAVAPSAPTAKPSKSVAQVANEVINGLWGSGNERNRRLMDAGYNASAIQTEVNRILKDYSSKPAAKPQAPVSSGSQAIKQVQSFLNAYAGNNIKVDGWDGANTRRAWIRAVQTELNKQFGTGLVIDGLDGPRTQSAWVTIHKGAKGNLTKLLQAGLILHGYSTNGFDGNFGSGTEKAVIAFQGATGQAKDGVPGKNTYKALAR